MLRATCFPRLKTQALTQSKKKNDTSVDEHPQPESLQLDLQRSTAWQVFAGKVSLGRTVLDKYKRKVDSPLSLKIHR